MMDNKTGLPIFSLFLALTCFVLPTESSAVPSECKVIIVGAGIGGAYVAHRLSETGKFPPTQICILEANKRSGGRILSVKGEVPGFEDYVVDLGAYR